MVTTTITTTAASPRRRPLLEVYTGLEEPLLHDEDITVCSRNNDGKDEKRNLCTASWWRTLFLLLLIPAHLLGYHRAVRSNSINQHLHLQDNTDMYPLWFGQACVALVNLRIAIYLYHNATKPQSCAVVTAFAIVGLETVLNVAFILGKSSSIATAWVALLLASASAVAMIKAHNHDHRKLVSYDDYDDDDESIDLLDIDPSMDDMDEQRGRFPWTWQHQ